MNLLDSRRLTGPSLLLDRPGAVLEVSLAPEEADAAVAAWTAQVRRMLDAVGWGGEEIAVRRFPGGASLAISAPIDGLYAATDINDWAWGAAEDVMAGRREPDLAKARRACCGRRSPARRTRRCIALRDAAAARGVAFLADDRVASVGLGKGVAVLAGAGPPRPRGGRLERGLTTSPCCW